MIRLFATLLMVMVLLFAGSAMAKPAPEFELDDLEGDTYSLDDLFKIFELDEWQRFRFGVIDCCKA